MEVSFQVSSHNVCQHLLNQCLLAGIPIMDEDDEDEDEDPDDEDGEV